eukprot:TRINITY_DN1265_c6_g1_i1.p1 TRINITY_DN1265_c6_g1~~TRINITY_DN1265_c6_g1_i1.p1  ORF type:complete len:935 (+),score=211.13 TRINITY_DN1265_c6_g1_i1:114-2807(+)
MQRHASVASSQRGHRMTAAPSLAGSVRVHLRRQESNDLESSVRSPWPCPVHLERSGSAPAPSAAAPAPAPQEPPPQPRARSPSERDATVAQQAPPQRPPPARHNSGSGARSGLMAHEAESLGSSQGSSRRPAPDRTLPRTRHLSLDFGPMYSDLSASQPPQQRQPSWSCSGRGPTPGPATPPPRPATPLPPQPQPPPPPEPAPPPEPTLEERVRRLLGVWVERQTEQMLRGWEQPPASPPPPQPQWHYPASQSPPRAPGQRCDVLHCSGEAYVLCAHRGGESRLCANCFLAHCSGPGDGDPSLRLGYHIQTHAPPPPTACPAAPPAVYVTAPPPQPPLRSVADAAVGTSRGPTPTAEQQPPQHCRAEWAAGSGSREPIEREPLWDVVSAWCPEDMTVAELSHHLLEAGASEEAVAAFRKGGVDGRAARALRPVDLRDELRIPSSADRWMVWQVLCGLFEGGDAVGAAACAAAAAAAAVAVAAEPALGDREATVAALERELAAMTVQRRLRQEELRGALLERSALLAGQHCGDAEGRGQLAADGLRLAQEGHPLRLLDPGDDAARHEPQQWSPRSAPSSTVSGFAEGSAVLPSAASGRAPPTISVSGPDPASDQTAFDTAVRDLVHDRTEALQGLPQGPARERSGVVAQALRSNRSLTDCNLAGLGLGDAASASIARSLAQHPRLTALSLAGNGQGAATARALAQGVSPTLRRLDLSRGALCDADASDLAALAAGSASLEEIELGDNPGLSSASVSALRLPPRPRGVRIAPCATPQPAAEAPAPDHDRASCARSLRSRHPQESAFARSVLSMDGRVVCPSVVSAAETLHGTEIMARWQEAQRRKGRHELATPLLPGHPLVTPRNSDHRQLDASQTMRMPAFALPGSPARRRNRGGVVG